MNDVLERGAAGSSFRDEDWYAEEIGAVRFVDCVFTDVDLTEATTNRSDGATVRETDLTRGDLRRASLDRVDVSSARLKETRIDLPAAVMLAELLGAVVDVGE